VRYSGASGFAIVLHMRHRAPIIPQPSFFGCLKRLPIRSTYGSIVTTAFGSNAYKSLTVTSRSALLRFVRALEAVVARAMEARQMAAMRVRDAALVLLAAL
jgi:hypothetical protein